MPITAKIRMGYAGRLAMIAAVCIGMSLWFLYDGAIGYPAKRALSLKYQEVQDEAEEKYADVEDDEQRKKLVQKEWFDAWYDYTEEHGFKAMNPGPPKSEQEILMQFVFAGVAAVPGIVFLAFLILSLRRWVKMDEEGVSNSQGQQVAFDDIATLDKTRWKKKGIAHIIFEKDGERQRLLLDDWKFETKPIEVILREVESRIQIERIVGGPPESDLDEACETTETGDGQLRESTELPETDADERT
jgi:hypothetical protein